MTTSKQVAPTQQAQAVEKPKTAKDFFMQQHVMGKFNELLGKRASGFVTSVLQAVNSSADLSQCDHASIFNAAATAATMDLPVNPNLGFAFIIGYNEKQRDGSFAKRAQFQMGWKGYVQLAYRTGLYKTVSVSPVFEGDTDESVLARLTAIIRPNAPSDKVLGYAAYFKLLNGFEKSLYMTVEELKGHGVKYSKAYSNPKTKAYSRWTVDFETMAMKTVLKLLLSKYAPLSIEHHQMQQALIQDQAVIEEVGATNPNYADNAPAEVDKEAERIRLMLEDCATCDEVEKLALSLPQDNDTLMAVSKRKVAILGALNTPEASKT